MMPAKISDEVRQQVEADLIKGVKHKEISATRGVSIGYVSKIYNRMGPALKNRRKKQGEAAMLVKRLANMRAPTRPKTTATLCQQCYWGKNTGSKITCFWRECKKGWPV